MKSIPPARGETTGLTKLSVFIELILCAEDRGKDVAGETDDLLDKATIVRLTAPFTDVKCWFFWGGSLNREICFLSGAIISSAD